MAVKRYDGSAWQTVAGLGAQGPAATSSSIATWVKTASGGETSLSGNDDNSQSLSYTIGQELVFINGVLQKRGADYTATTGTSITGLAALTANDIVTVWSNNAFSVTNAISNTIVDAKGDILVGTAADTPGRLAVGTDGQVLTASSTTGTGLTWTTPAAGGKVLQVVYATTSSGASLTGQTWTDTNLTATITPSSTSSKVLVFWFQDYYSSGGNNGILYRLRRNTTTIQENQNAGTLVLYNVSSGQGNMAANSYLDSPATTSATTYKTQMNNYLVGGTCVAQPDSNKPSSMVLMEIGV